MHCRVVLLRDGARLPTKAHPGDVAWDLYAVESRLFDPGETATIDTGIAIELPPGYGAQIHGRSSQSRAGIHVSTGVIDGGFRGSISIVITNLSPHLYQVEAGMRIGQLEIVRIHDFEMVEVLTLGDTARGTGSFGSSGK